MKSRQEVSSSGCVRPCGMLLAHLRLTVSATRQVTAWCRKWAEMASELRLDVPARAVAVVEWSGSGDRLVSGRTSGSFWLGGFPGGEEVVRCEDGGAGSGGTSAGYGQERGVVVGAGELAAVNDEPCEVARVEGFVVQPLD